MPLHKDLSGSELHENKGVASASDDTVATAESGVTVWKKVNEDMLDNASIFMTNKLVLSAVIDDVSTASSIYIPIPFACTVEEVYAALGAAITGADAVVSIKNSAGSSMGTLTVAYSGSAAGDIVSTSPSSNNTFTAGTKLQIDTDGGSTGTAKLQIVIVATVTG